MDLAAWLKEIGLAEHASAFAENAIDMTLLPELTDADLRELGISRMGDRKRLLAAIRRIGADEATTRDLSTEPGERRQVTVLFADIAGFTAMSGPLGDEGTHAILNRFFMMSDAVIQDYGGAVDKHIGDNVMAVFGAPRAHDNDPERAVRAALALHRKAADIHGPLGPLQLHIGIACGLVVASGTGSDSHREYTVIGETVNLASRLEGLAQPGQTLVSEMVALATPLHFVFDALGPQDIKGIARPVPVFSVKTEAAVPLPTRSTPFVGRQGEQGQCLAILDQALRTGRGRMISLRGVAGIGKTRLSEEVTRAARERGFNVHRGTILDFGSRKEQDMVAAVIRDLTGLAPKASLSDAELASFLTDLTPVESALAKDLLALPLTEQDRAVYDVMDDPSRRSGRRRLMTRLAARASALQPQLIVVEDLHWADQHTLDVLAGLVETTRDHPLVLLATTRPEGDPLEGHWRSLTLDHPVSIINLGPLPLGEARELALSFARANLQHISACLDRASGNPLFLEQLLQNAAESAETSVPGSIRSIVLARLDRLAPKDKRALQMASIFGQRFELSTLQTLLKDPDYDCAGPLRQHLLQSDGPDLVFAHALIRDCIYDSVLTNTRADLHRQIAERVASSDPALRAEHLDKAQDPAAVAAYQDAAQIERRHYRYDRAIDLLRRAAEIATKDPDRRDIALALGETLQNRGASGDAMAVFDQVLKIPGDPVATSRARIGLAGSKRILDDLDGALADLDIAEAEATAAGLDTERAAVHVLRGNLMFPRGEIDACLREHTAALGLARSVGNPELEAAALGGLADAEYLRGKFHTAMVLFKECVALSRQQGFSRTEVANMPMIGITAFMSGEGGPALDAANEAIETAQRVGNLRAEMVAHHGAYFCRRYRGELDLARAHVAAALEASRTLNAPRFEAEALAFDADLDLLQGFRTQALTTARTAVAISRETGMSYLGPMILGVLYAAATDADERDKAGIEAETLLAEGSINHNHVLFRNATLEACLRDGMYEEALRHVHELRRQIAEPEAGVVTFFADYGSVLARIGMGDRSRDIADALSALLASAKEMDLMLLLPDLERAGAELRHEHDTPLTS